VQEQAILNQIELLKAEGNKAKAAELLNKLAFEKWEKNEELKSLKFFEQSISLNKELKNDNAIKIIYGNMGAIYSDLGQVETAIVFYRKSLLLSKKTNDKNNTAINLLNIGVELKKMRRFNESLKNIEKSLNIFIELDNKKFIRRCYGELYDNYEKMDNVNKAKEYLNKYINQETN